MCEAENLKGSSTKTMAKPAEYWCMVMPTDRHRQSAALDLTVLREPAAGVEFLHARNLRFSTAL